MISEWIYDKLIKRLNKKKHDVVKLEWKKAELERALEQAKERKKNAEYKG